MSLLLAGRVDAFDAIETEHYCFEHFGDGFCLFALEIVEYASKLSYRLPAHRHISSHLAEIFASAALGLFGSGGRLRRLLPQSIHCWRVGDETIAIDLKL